MIDGPDPKADGVSFHPFTLVLAALLLMLAEYVLIGWTQNYGADRDVLSHVGFAGTIVSMILGVVAIIYAFYQGFAQQQDAQALAAQLTELRTVADGLRTAGTSISDSGSALQDLRTTLEQTLQISRSTHAALESIKQSQTQPQQLATPAGDADLDLDRLAARLVRSAYPTQEAIYEALCYAAEKGLTARAYASFVAEMVRERLTAQGKAHIAENMGQWVDGVASGYHDILTDIGLAGYMRAPDATGPPKITVSPEFLQRVRAATGTQIQAAPDLILDVPSIRQAIKERAGGIGG